MISKGIRGAITVDNNSKEALKEATLELLLEMFMQYCIEPPLSMGGVSESDGGICNNSTENISHIIFTTTNDLNAEFPAKFARLDMGLKDTAMMCFHELDVPNSLPMCLRILIVLNCEENFIPKFVYLKGAESLRKHISMLENQA
ncbi:chorismate mutase [bacterium]|nr:chorismate mutase [bacterium]